MDGMDGMRGIAARGLRRAAPPTAQGGARRFGRRAGKAALCLAGAVLATACDLSSQPSDRPLPTPPSRLPPALPPSPGALAIVDALPASQALIDPAHDDVVIAHLAPANLIYTYAGGCSGSGAPLRRRVAGLSSATAQELVEHRLRCNLRPLESHRVAVRGRAGDEVRVAQHGFATRAAGGPAELTVLDWQRTTRHDVNGLFEGYVERLLDALGSSLLTRLLEEAVEEIAGRAWGELSGAHATYDVLAQRVSYPSRNPYGEPDETLTGLVALPEVASPSFSRRGRVVVLSHATGSTPSGLDATDTWFILANMLAGRGYLVIAPDNWGRGQNRRGPETYLLANRVANNTIDMVRAVLRSEDYQAFHAAGTDADVALIGYSQGGHSAFATWLAAASGTVEGLNVRELYSGGAPYNLHQTVLGALESFAGQCDGNPWCRHVEADVVLQYVGARIMEGFLAYTASGLTVSDVLSPDGRSIAPEFLRGMIGRDGRHDAVKALLQINSFANLTNLSDAISSSTRIQLYHSEYDRLVPRQNTVELAAALDGAVDVTFHEDECGSSEYEALAGLVDTVGIVHAVCALEMLDEALQDLRDIERAAGGTTR